MIHSTAARVAVFLFALAAGLHSAAAAGAQDDRDPRLVAAMAQFLGLEDAPPGAIIIIRRGNDETVYAAGAAALKCGPGPTGCDGVRPPRASDHMRIASVSKAFSGAAALALIAERRLDLDDTIGALLPDLPRRWHRVTVRQLLNHTSGLPDYTGSRGFAEYLTAWPTDPPTPRQLLDFVAHVPLQFRPGSRYRYSNSDNIAVGLIVEAVTSQPYRRVLHSSVFRPLGLDGTDLRPNVRLPRPYLHGYAKEDGLFVDVSEEVAFGGYAWASGGIVSTPSDLVRFAAAYVGGELFRGKARGQQYRFVPGAESSPPGPGRNAAGLGLFRYRTGCGTVFGHTGSILGYTQFFAATRSGQVAITVSVNGQAGEALIPALRRLQELAVCVALGG